MAERSSGTLGSSASHSNAGASFPTRAPDPSKAHGKDTRPSPDAQRSSVSTPGLLGQPKRYYSPPSWSLSPEPIASLKRKLVFLPVPSTPSSPTPSYSCTSTKSALTKSRTADPPKPGAYSHHISPSSLGSLGAQTSVHVGFIRPPETSIIGTLVNPKMAIKNTAAHGSQQHRLLDVDDQPFVGTTTTAASRSRTRRLMRNFVPASRKWYSVLTIPRAKAESPIGPAQDRHQKSVDTTALLQRSYAGEENPPSRPMDALFNSSMSQFFPFHTHLI